MLILPSALNSTTSNQAILLSLAKFPVQRMGRLNPDPSQPATRVPSARIRPVQQVRVQQRHVLIRHALLQRLQRGPHPLRMRVQLLALRQPRRRPKTDPADKPQVQPGARGRARVRQNAHSHQQRTASGRRPGRQDPVLRRRSRQDTRVPRLLFPAGQSAEVHVLQESAADHRQTATAGVLAADHTLPRAGVHQPGHDSVSPAEYIPYFRAVDGR